jgi:molecular chaperone GrpE (heat shock protein)
MANTELETVVAEFKAAIKEANNVYDRHQADMQRYEKENEAAEAAVRAAKSKLEVALGFTISGIRAIAAA